MSSEKWKNIEVSIKNLSELVRKPYTRDSISEKWRVTQANGLITCLNKIIELESGCGQEARKFYDRYKFLIDLSLERLKLNFKLPKNFPRDYFQFYPETLKPTDFIATVTENLEEEDLVSNINVSFDIKTALALVSNYNGEAINLEPFIDSIDLLNKITTAANHATMLTFIKSKLIGKARDVCRNATTFDGIKESLTNTCKSIEKSETLCTKLKVHKNKKIMRQVFVTKYQS